MKGERHPKSAFSCLKAKAVRTSSGQRGRGKGKPVSIDHWHFLLSWPLSPGSTQRKGCQVSVTGPKSFFLCIQGALWYRGSRRNLHWNLGRKVVFPVFSLWSFIQNRKSLMYAYVNITTERYKDSKTLSFKFSRNTHPLPFCAAA